MCVAQKKKSSSARIPLFLLLIFCGASTESEVSRFRRAPADDIITNLQRLSRIASGVALEIGLQDGSLSPDDAVAELLHLGTVTPSKIIGLEAATVNNAMVEFTTLRSGIVSSKEVTAIETRLLALEEIRTSFDVARFKKLPEKTEYQTLLKEVAKLDGEKPKLQPIRSNAHSLYPVLGKFVKLGEGLNAATATGEKGRMASLVLDIQSVQDDAKSFDSVSKLLKDTKALKTKSSFLKLLLDEFAIRAKVKGAIQYNSLPDVTKNFNAVYSYQTKANYKEPLETLLDLLHTRDASFVQPFSFASGLPHGAQDLESLAGDLSDGWIQKKGGNATKSLKIAFDLLTNLKDQLTTVEKDWKSIHTQSTPTEAVLQLQASIFNIPDNSASIPTAISKFQQAEKVRDGSDKDISDFKDVQDWIEQLNAKIDHVNTFDYVDQLKDLSFLKTILSGTPQPNESDVDFVKRIVQSLNSDTRVAEVIKSLEKFHTDLGVLEKLIPEITPLVQNIDTGFAKITNYHDAVAKDQKTKFYTDIASIGDSGIGEMLEIIQKIRQADVAPAKPFIDSALKPKQALSDAKEAAEKVKTLKTRELAALKDSLQDCLKVAEKLGMGVQGLLAIQSATNSKSALSPVLKNVKAILQASSGLAKEHQDSLQKLNGLVSTFEKIDEFEKGFAGYQALRRKRNSNFKDFGKLFEDAAKVPDFKEDLKPIQDAIDQLNLATQNKFAAARTTLDRLDTLDLEFSRYKIGDAKDTLTALDTFFADFTTKMAAAPAGKQLANAPSGTGKQTVAPQSSTDSVVSTTPKAGMATGTIILIVCAAIFVICAAAITAYCLCKKKKDDEEDSRGTPIDVVVTPGSKDTTTASSEEDPKPKDPKSKDPKSKESKSKESKSKDSKSKDSNPKKDPKPKDDKGDGGAGTSGTTPSTSKDDVKEDPKETPKEDPKGDKSVEPKVKTPDDKTQANGTVSEAADLSKTNEDVSAQRNSKAPVSQEKEKRSKRTKSPEKIIYADPKKRPLTPMPESHIPSKLKDKKGVDLPGELRYDDPALKTADEPSEQRRIAAANKPPPGEANFALVNSALAGIRGYREVEKKTPNQFLGLNCNIDGDKADCAGRKVEYSKQRRDVKNTVRANFRFEELTGFEDKFLDCNFKLMGVRWYMGMAPLKGGEWLVNEFKESTLNKHVAFLFQAKIRVVIKLCGWVSRNKQSICARYYSEIVGEGILFGSYKVTTIGKGELDGFTNKNEITIWKLSITDMINHKTNEVDVVVYSGWNDENRTPRDPLSSVEMIQYADGFKEPVLVHCVDGVTRSGALVAIKYGMWRAKAGDAIDIQTVIRNLRQSRFGVVQKVDQVSFIVLCVTLGTMNDLHIEYLDAYWEMYYYHQQICQKAYDTPYQTGALVDVMPGTDEKRAINFMREDECTKDEFIKLKRREFKKAEEQKKKQKLMFADLADGKVSRESSKKSKKEQKSKRSKGGSKDQV